MHRTDTRANVRTFRRDLRAELARRGAIELLDNYTDTEIDGWADAGHDPDDAAQGIIDDAVAGASLYRRAPW